MTTVIKVLSDQAINQIAAGEVIENPSSVVKELIENSLDAGSTEIEVTFIAGGRQLIRVVDDGCGMGADDALLCLERHATSKISSVDDLASVTTMGFRGEAIPSIAAVSHFTLLTSNGKACTKVTIHGGKITDVSPAARVQGTTIEVGSLFFNTPVRQKFLKSVGYDAAEIGRVVLKSALAHPNVAFSLYNGAAKVLATYRGEELPDRIAALIGDEMLPLKTERVWGMLAKPGDHRANRMGQHLFINGRPVFSRLISEAVKEGYGTRLPTGRFPAFVLHCNFPLDLVDVNVHPQKKEVRLRQQQEVRQQIVQAVNEALSDGPPIPTYLPWEHESISPPAPYDSPPSPTPRAQEQVEQPALVTLPIQILAIYDHFILVDGSSLPKAREGVVVIDAKRAAARILFEEMTQALDGKEVASQGLLIPVTVDMSEEEGVILHDHLDSLRAIGLGIRPFSGGSFVIDALPASIGVVEVERLVRDLAEGLKKERHVAKVASQLAAKRVPAISRERAPGVVKQLFATADPFHSPQGLPTMRQLKLEELFR